MAENDAPQTSESKEPVASEGGFSEAFAERAAPAKSEETPEAGAETPAAKEEPSANADEAPAPSQEAAAETSGTGKPDPWDGLTPEQREKVTKLEASDRSNRGRVGALTKKLNGFIGTQKPPAQTGESRERKDEGTEGTEAEGKEPKAADIEARLAASVDEYADIVGPVAELVNELRSEIAGLKASATRNEVDDDAEALTKAYAELESKHSDYGDYNEDHPAFVEWFKKQPQGVKALVNSFDPAEVSLALTLFKTETGVAQSKPEVTEGDDEGGDGETATGERRERQLDGLRQVPNRGAPAATGVPDDFSAAFKSRAKAKAS